MVSGAPPGEPDDPDGGCTGKGVCGIGVYPQREQQEAGRGVGLPPSAGYAPGTAGSDASAASMRSCGSSKSVISPDRYRS